MAIFQDIVLFFVILFMLAVSGCSSLRTQDPVYSMAVLSRADLLSGQALFGKKIPSSSLPEDHVMAINDKMRDYLDRYVPRHYSDKLQIRNLTTMMIAKGILGMEYDPTKTLTAEEAFRRAEGNCLAFSYLFVTLARERGLRVYFQEVEIPPQWDHVGGEIYYLSRHVNVKVMAKENLYQIFDIDNINYKPYYRSWIISDNKAVGLYYGNKGADYLYEGDFKNAFRYIVKSLELSPKDASLWSNLGVLYRMKKMYSYAEKAYFVALKYDYNNRSVLSNLSAMYDKMGEDEKSSYYAKLAAQHQLKNPYYRYYQAVAAFNEGDYQLALEHLEEALKSREDERDFLELLGDTYAKLGEDDKERKTRIKIKNLSELQ